MNIRRINIMKLQMIGIIPDHLDKETEYNLDINRVPFSRHYMTHKDYLNDQLKAYDISDTGNEIPEELFQKLIETRKEIESRGESLI